MVVFLAKRENLQSKRLHDRIHNRLGGELRDVRRRRAEPREAGQYRVVGEVTPRQYLDDPNYPATTARIEVGFRLRTGDRYEHYWFTWIEPNRDVLVGVASGRHPRRSRPRSRSGERRVDGCRAPNGSIPRHTPARRRRTSVRRVVRSRQCGHMGRWTPSRSRRRRRVALTLGEMVSC